MNLILYKQTDSRWTNDILGYNPAKAKITLGSHGCLVSDVAMMVSTATGDPNWTPRRVNQILQANNGFAPNGGLLYWQKIPELWPFIHFERTAATLKEVNDWLKSEANFAILKVNDGAHYVWGTANGQMADPLTGSIRPITTYKFNDAHLYTITGGKGSAPAPIETVNGDTLMKPEEEANAYRILFNRPDEAPNSTPRSGYQMIVEAEPELINERATMAADLAIAQQQAIDANKRAADDKEFAKELKQERDDLEAKVKELTTPQAPDPLLALKASEMVHEISRVTIAAGEMVDYGGTGGVPSYAINAGTHFKQHSTFTVDGIRYVRTEKSADTNQWYGTPENLFDPVEAPVATRTKVDAAHLAASSLVATIGKWLYSKFTKH